jgi:hypothetical protein
MRLHYLLSDRASGLSINSTCFTLDSDTTQKGRTSIFIEIDLFRSDESYFVNIFQLACTDQNSQKMNRSIWI